MDFEDFLRKYAPIINKRLDEILEESLEKIDKTSPELNKLYEEFVRSSKNGKRVRGALVLLGYQIGKRKNPGSRIGSGTTAAVLDAAVAFEIFQTSILAQDDVIDKSTTRRGKPSLYKALGGDDKAVAQAICLADLGFFAAYRLISNLKVDDVLKVRGINLFSQTLTQTVLGEMLDIETPFLKRDFEDQDSLKIALLKTARYTISGPLMLGMILAGAEEEKLKKLQVFGDSLGIAFQIQDDIWGVFGDEQVIGKSSVSDIKERKATLLIAYAQKNGDRRQKESLKKNYGNSEIDEGGVKEVRSIFKETGALGYAESQAAKYFSKAERALKGEQEGLLYSLIEYVKVRQS